LAGFDKLYKKCIIFNLEGKLGEVHLIKLLEIIKRKKTEKT